MGKQSSNDRRRVKGLGSVYFDNKNNCWVGSMEAGLTESGKRKRKKFTGPTQAAVVKKMKEYQLSPESLLTSADASTTFSRFGCSYLVNYKKTRLKRTSYTSEYKVFHNNIEPYIGFIQLSSITPDIIQIKLLNALANKGYSLSTLHKAYVLTNEIMRHAYRTRLIPNNPCEFVTAPNKRTLVKPKKEIRVLNDEEIERFAKVALSPKRKNGKFVLSIIYTGLRCGEASALKWSDIDFKNNVIIVRSNMEHIYEDVDGNAPQRAVIEQQSTKTRDYRRVFMTKSARRYLQELYDERQPDPNDYVTYYQKEPSPDVLHSAYRCIARTAQIDNAQGIHTLRHTCASLLIRNGVDIKIISEMLGHSNVAFTYDTYVHIIEEHAKSVIEEIDV